jgi:hypothetical protein
MNRLANMFLEETIDEDEGIKIFFENLDEETQETVMNAIRKAFNVSKDDGFGNDKIVEGLAKAPLFTLRGEEIKRLINIDV